MLRPAFDNGCDESRPPLIMIDGEEEFHKWKGYGPAYNSWEPGHSLRKNVLESLKEY